MAEAHLPAWDIDEGIRNAEKFFRALPKLFPDANLFIAQGSRIADDVAAFYRQHAPAVSSRPADLSRFTLTRRYFCLPSPEFFLELARFAAKKPREQLLHHLYLYRDGHQLIECTTHSRIRYSCLRTFPNRQLRRSPKNSACAIDVPPWDDPRRLTNVAADKHFSDAAMPQRLYCACS
jgi:hypothetical protein